jgi:hypothetical protein
MTETEIANLALGLIGGAGDQLTGGGFLSSIDDDDRISTWCKANFAICRRRVISDLAARKTPFRETSKFADLGSALDSDDLPETGQWEYAFNLPSDCLAVVMQFDELYMKDRFQSVHQYNYEVITNKAESGKILLTDDLCNLDDDGAQTSAFIEYVFDQSNTGMWSEAFITCFITLFASLVAPVVGKDIKVHQDMLYEYIQAAVPVAQSFNQSQFNNQTRITTNYLGGRNSTLRVV